jgi:hypothetical protein
MQTKQDLREPALLMTLKIMLHAKLCLSVIIFLICVVYVSMSAHGKWDGK